MERLNEMVDTTQRQSAEIAHLREQANREHRVDSLLYSSGKATAEFGSYEAMKHKEFPFIQSAVRAASALYDQSGWGEKEDPDAEIELRKKKSKFESYERKIAEMKKKCSGATCDKLKKLEDQVKSIREASEKPEDNRKSGWGSRGESGDDAIAAALSEGGGKKSWGFGKRKTVEDDIDAALMEVGMENKMKENVKMQKLRKEITSKMADKVDEKMRAEKKKHEEKRKKQEEEKREEEENEGNVGQEGQEGERQKEVKESIKKEAKKEEVAKKRESAKEAKKKQKKEVKAKEKVKTPGP